MTSSHAPAQRLVSRPPKGALPEHDLFSQPVDDDSIQGRFDAFHAAHPEVYTELVAMARKANNAGHRIGMKALFEVLRWNRFVERDDDAPFLLNNVFTSRYVRLIEQQEPDLVGFFEKRRLTS